MDGIEVVDSHQRLLRQSDADIGKTAEEELSALVTDRIEDDPPARRQQRIDPPDHLRESSTVTPDEDRIRSR